MDYSSSTPLLPSSYRPNDRLKIEVQVHPRPGEPERYRLSAARLAEPPKPKTSRPIHFWFRTRYVSAMATQLSDRHPNVLGLQLRPSTVANMIVSATRFLPVPAQDWVKDNFPEWFIPNRVVLKMQKTGEYQEMLNGFFDAELKAYSVMKPLQGLVIPRFFGRASYHGQRAMILEYLEGLSIDSPEGATRRPEELVALLLPCYGAMHSFRVQYDDPNPSNFVLMDQKMMVVDLERIVFNASDSDMKIFTKMSVQGLADRYVAVQAYHRQEGSLEAA